MPLLYVTIGTLLLLGAMYIGVSHGLMPVYVALGSSCVIAGISVTYIRYRSRCHTEADSA